MFRIKFLAAAGRILGLLLFCLLLTPLQAQDNGEDKLGAWYMYFGTNRVSERWSIHSEAQFRFYDLASNFNQLLLRTGANYHISDRAIATLGYAYIWTDPTFEDGGALLDRISEHRIFQQFLLYNQVGQFRFEHRYRLEQRFLDFDGPADTEHRARYRLQVTYPLNDTYFLNAYDEVFINLQEPLFGQNRLYFALGARVSPALSLQAGYLLNSFTGADYHRLQLGVFFNPDLRKTREQP